MAEVKNVLSIDLDYIMAPTIQLYNNFVSTTIEDLVAEYGPDGNWWGSQCKTFWEWMNEELYMDKYLAFDDAKYKAIINLLKNKSKDLPDGNIYFGKEHDSILTFLCGDEKKEDYCFNIYNVDHHHDIYYSDKGREEIERFAFAEISDWVWYLYDFGKLNDYKWISNTESKYPLFELPERSAFSKMHDIENVSELEDIDFDYIFVCKSEFYLPYKYHFLFDEVKKTVEEVKNTRFIVDNLPYCLNGQSRFPVNW